MATNTPNLNLVKPEMSDYADIRVLNGNMDILDNAIPLEYIKSIVKSDEGLLITKKDDTEIIVPLNYLKLTGGDVTGDVNITGSLLINNKPPLYVVDVQDTTAENGLKVKSVKYSDGQLYQYIITPTGVENVTATYPIPFKDTNDMTVSVGYIAPSGAGSVNFGFYTPNNFTTTGCSFNVGSVISYTYTIRGYWK